MDDHITGVIDQTDRLDARFAIVTASVFLVQRRAIKNQGRNEYVNAMLFEIAAALLFIPFEFQVRIPKVFE